MSAPEASAQARSAGSAFRGEVERLMAERGIEDLEDLYGRFMAQEPERIGNARWTYERFLKYVNHEVGSLDPRFIVPLTRGALETKPTQEARLFLAWVEDATGRRS